MNRILLLLALAGPARADIPRVSLESGLPAGTASELKPLAFSAELSAFLVERVDKRAGGEERSWNLYGKTMDLLGYATLTTEGGVSTANVQWLSDGEPAARAAMADLAQKARDALRAEPKALDKVWASWQKLKAVPRCPVKAARRESSFDLVGGSGAQAVTVAVVDAPLSGSDAKRGCTAAAPEALRCFAGAAGDVVVVAPFKQDCAGPVVQQQIVLYNPRNVEYLVEAQLGAQALDKGDLAGAKRHVEASLKLAPKHAPAIFTRACIAARSGVAFREGRAELEQILGSEEERQTWLPAIKSQASLATWRADPEFPRWFAGFPTRTPIR